MGNFSKQSSKLNFSFKIFILRTIKIYSIQYPATEKKADKKDKDDKPHKKRNITFDLIKHCISVFFDFIKTVFKSMNVRKLETHIDLGLTSYASTAKYVGYLWALFVLPNSTFKNTSMTASPHFGEPIIDFKGVVDIRINLLNLIIPIIKLISNKDVRKLLKEVI